MITIRDRYLFSVVGIVAIVYAFLAVQFLDRLKPLTGDEPFYVMTAISIVRDGDLDEANNYADRDYEEFYPSDPLPRGWNGWPSFPRTLPPHPATTDLGGIHTKHGLGLSALIAIPYELGGRASAVAVIAIMGGLVAVNMFLLAVTSGATPQGAAVIAVMLAVSMPIAPYSVLLFPEVPAALLLIYAIRRLSEPANTRMQWWLIGTALGFLPWLHQRFVPTTVVLVVIALVRLWNARNTVNAVVSLIPIAASGFGLIGYNLWLYRSPIQDSADHAGFNGISGTINAVFGLLLDAQWGLIIVAPIYVIALAAVPLWIRESTLARVAAVASLPYILVVASYRVWWGEWGPAARYLVPIVPLAAGAIAVAYSHVNVGGRVVIGVGFVIGMAVTFVGVKDPQGFYHHPNGVNNLYSTADSWFGTELAEMLVAFQPLSPSPMGERVGISLLLVAVVSITTVVIVRPSVRVFRRHHSAGRAVD